MCACTLPTKYRFPRGGSKYRGVPLHKCGRRETRMGQFLGKKLVIDIPATTAASSEPSGNNAGAYHCLDLSCKFKPEERITQYLGLFKITHIELLQWNSNSNNSLPLCNSTPIAGTIRVFRPKDSSLVWDFIST